MTQEVIAQGIDTPEVSSIPDSEHVTNAQTSGEQEQKQSEQAENAAKAEVSNAEDTQSHKKSGFQRRIEKLAAQRDEARSQLDNTLKYQHTLEQKLGALNPPRREQFQDDSDFLMAAAQFNGAGAGISAQREVSQVQADHARQNYQQQAVEIANEIVNSGTEKYPDMAQRVNNPNLPSLPVHQPAAFEAIITSNIADDLVYHIASNPNLAKELVDMSPVQAVRKITQLEGEIKSKQARLSKAPPPVNTIGSSNSGGKSPSNMSYEEYKAWRLGK
ncbi:MAG: hypothetical protein ACRCVX_13735 [Shewanella sp.]